MQKISKRWRAITAAFLTIAIVLSAIPIKEWYDTKLPTDTIEPLHQIVAKSLKSGDRAEFIPSDKDYSIQGTFYREYLTSDGEGIVANSDEIQDIYGKVVVSKLPSDASAQKVFALSKSETPVDATSEFTGKYFVVSGHSMEPTLKPGDILYLQAGPVVDNDIVLAKVGDKLVVKRLKTDIIVSDGEGAAYSLRDAQLLGKLSSEGEHTDKDYSVDVFAYNSPDFTYTGYTSIADFLNANKDGYNRPLYSGYSLVSKPEQFFGYNTNFYDSSGMTFYAFQRVGYEYYSGLSYGYNLYLYAQENATNKLYSFVPPYLSKPAPPTPKFDAKWVRVSNGYISMTRSSPNNDMSNYTSFFTSEQKFHGYTYTKDGSPNVMADKIVYTDPMDAYKQSGPSALLWNLNPTSLTEPLLANGEWVFLRTPSVGLNGITDDLIFAIRYKGGNQPGRGAIYKYSIASPVHTYYYNIEYAYIRTADFMSWYETSSNNSPVISNVSPANQNVTIGPSGSISLNLRVSDVDSGQTVVVSASMKGIQKNIVIPASATPTPITFTWTATELQNNFTQNIAITATDNKGGTASNNTAQVTAVVDIAAPTIASVTASNITDTSANITFSASDNNTLPASPYRLSLNSGGYSSVPSSPYALAGLTPDTDYTATLEVTDIVGNKSTKASPQFTTLAKPPIVAGLSVTSSTSANISIGANGNPIRTQYKIERSTSSAFTPAVTTLVRDWSNSLSFADTYTSGLRYYYRVKARNNAGVETAWSDPSTVLIKFTAVVKDGSKVVIEDTTGAFVGTKNCTAGGAGTITGVALGGGKTEVTFNVTGLSDTTFNMVTLNNGYVILLKAPPTAPATKTLDDFK